LRHRLHDVPANIIPHIRMGFSLFSKLDGEKRENVQTYVIENFAGKGSYDLEEAKKVSGLDGKIVGDLISSITLAVGAIFDIQVSKEDFFRFASQDLLPDEYRDSVGTLIDHTVACRDTLKLSVDKSRIASAVIPAFRHIDCEVDLRFKFDDSRNISDSAAVTLCYIKTDHDKDIFFQLEQRDLEKLISDLQSSLENLKIINSKKWS